MSVVPLLAASLAALLSPRSSEALMPARAFQLAAARLTAPSTVERFVLLDAAGRVVATGSGGKSRIDLDERVRTMVRDAGCHLMLIHNHPKGSSLSPDDVDLFISSPGLTFLGVVAAGGMMYTISGARPTASKIFFERYSEGRMQLRSQMRNRELKGLSHHLLTEMSREGLIKYNAVRLQERSSAAFVSGIERVAADDGCRK